MKKLLVLVLVIALAFSMVACKKDDDNKDSGNANKQYVESILNELAAAETITLSASVNMNTTSDDEEVSVVGEATLTLAKTQTGYNAKATFSGELTEDNESFPTSGEAILVDGKLYLSSDGYTEEIDLNNADGSVQIMEMLNTFLNGDALALPESAGDALVTAFAEVLGAATKDGGYKFEADFKDDVQAFVDYVATFDSITIGDVVNKLLSLIDPELTVEDILTSIKGMKDKTLAQVYNEIDASVKQETGMNIQELYTEILSDEQIKGYLLDYGVISEEEYEQFKNLNIYQTLEGTGYLNMTVNQLVEAMFDVGIGAITGTIEDYLALNMEDFLYEMLGESAADCFFDTIASIDADELYFKLHFKANGNKFTGIDANIKVDYAMTVFESSHVYDDSTDTYHYEVYETPIDIVCNVSVSLTLSSETTVIAKP